MFSICARKIFDFLIDLSAYWHYGVQKNPSCMTTAPLRLAVDTARVTHNLAQMNQTTILELKHQTSKVPASVESGGSMEICRRGKPDFEARLREIYGDRVLAGTGTGRVSETRGIR
jgi:hypothetical protein